MNQEIQRQKEDIKKVEEVKNDKWTYGNVIEKTGNFFYKMVGTFKK